MSEESLQKFTQNEIARNSIYRCNHDRIIATINEIIDEGQIPTATEIAIRTHLSRTTVHKHLNAISISRNDPEVLELRRQRLIDKLYDHAVGKWNELTTPASSLKAIELYLKYTSTDSPSTSNKTVNIQINS